MISDAVMEVSVCIEKLNDYKWLFKMLDESIFFMKKLFIIFKTVEKKKIIRHNIVNKILMKG